MKVQRSFVLIFTLILFSMALTVSPSIFGAVTSPLEQFGFTPGDDGRLLTYEEMISYLKKLESESPMIKLVPIGKSTLGKTMYAAFISDAENINRLDELKEINKRLAIDPNLSESERNALVAKGRVFFIATLSMHSNEVGPSQAAPLIAYRLITSTDPEIRNYLKNVVYMMIPCHNPDGMDMIVAHYKKYKNTKYDGCSMPGLYHKYVGHDDNRDFVTLSQKETQVISRLFSLEWFPQVMVEKHQMGSTGARFFVPPNHDPIAVNVDAGLWNWMEVFGANVIKDMTAKGEAGVSYNYIFDNYWPGSTETCLWKNVISFLTECASAHLASPIYIEPNELNVGGKGLSEYKKSVNFPLPWKGGWWKLSD
ncbi:peptidase M14, partial [bacterium]|nr:peptidase M14 [bacterium]